jgi:type II secretory pathway component HofQ
MDNEIGIDLKTQVSSLGNIEKIGDVNYYIIGNREVKSKVQAKIGETIFLGGLITQAERESFQKIPFLGDLPVLGKMFQNKEKSKDEKELIITITPRWNQPVKLDLENKNYETKTW